jgi:hypothetical protein
MLYAPPARFENGGDRRGFTNGLREFGVAALIWFGAWTVGIGILLLLGAWVDGGW